MAQANIRKVTYSSIVGAAAFRQGVEDYRAGRGFNPAYDSAKGAAWQYERGRLYAAACAGLGKKPEPNRFGRAVSRIAIMDFAAFYRRGDIL